MITAMDSIPVSKNILFPSSSLGTKDPCKHHQVTAMEQKETLEVVIDIPIEENNCYCARDDGNIPPPTLERQLTGHKWNVAAQMLISSSQMSTIVAHRNSKTKDELAEEYSSLLSILMEKGEIPVDDEETFISKKYVDEWQVLHKLSNGFYETEIIYLPPGEIPSQYMWVDNKTINKSIPTYYDTKRRPPV